MLHCFYLNSVNCIADIDILNITPFINLEPQKFADDSDVRDFVLRQSFLNLYKISSNTLNNLIREWNGGKLELSKDFYWSTVADVICNLHFVLLKEKHIFQHLLIYYHSDLPDFIALAVWLAVVDKLLWGAPWLLLKTQITVIYGCRAKRFA